MKLLSFLVFAILNINLALAQEVPTIPNLQRINVGGAWVKTLTGDFNFNVDVIAIQSMNKTVPVSWNPTQPSDIPFPWPASYITWGQPFSASGAGNWAMIQCDATNWVIMAGS